MMLDMASARKRLRVERILDIRFGGSSQNITDILTKSMPQKDLKEMMKIRSLHRLA